MKRIGLVGVVFLLFNLLVACNSGGGGGGGGPKPLPSNTISPPPGPAPTGSPTPTAIPTHGPYIPASTWRMQCIIGTSFANIHATAKNCDGKNLSNLSYASGTNILAAVLDLTNSTFIGANLEKAVLIYAVINNVKFNNANLAKAQFGGAGNTINSTDFTNSTMTGLTVIPGTNFTNDNFDNANLVGASIGGSGPYVTPTPNPTAMPAVYNNMSTSQFNGAKFGTGTTFSYTNFNSINFRPVIENSGTTFASDHFTNGVFDGSLSPNAPSLSFVNSTFSGTTFSNFMSPTSWSFSGSTLTGVTFHFNANAQPASWSFVNAVLNNVTFSPKFAKCVGFTLTGCSGSSCSCSNMCSDTNGCVNP